jgi:hypothetical protein
MALPAVRIFTRNKAAEKAESDELSQNWLKDR